MARAARGARLGSIDPARRGAPIGTVDRAEDRTSRPMPATTAGAFSSRGHHAPHEPPGRHARPAHADHRQTAPERDRHTGALSNQEIADSLGVSFFTARNHVERLLPRLAPDRSS